MDTPAGFPFGMDPEALRDAPLFQELQRVMAASSGPVNWELARQVGIATAVEGGHDAVPTEQDHKQLEEVVRVAELQVATFTGLEPPGDVALVRAIRRAEWVTVNSGSLRGLLEPAARQMGEALERSMREQMPSDLGAVGGLLAQLGPLLQGTQVGQVLGILAQRVLGQYDIAVPREGPGTLLFVVPNIAAFENDWSLEPVEFRTYVALHEVTHRYEFAQPWARERFVELTTDFLSTITIDVAAIQERFASLDPADPDGLERALGSEDEGALFGTILDDEQRLKLARIQAFMAAAEGYGDHVMHGVGSRLLGSYDRITEAMKRYREAAGPADPVFERLLGVEMKREQYELGRRFCDEVAGRSSEETLSMMWSSADALPSMVELEEPTLWLSRTA